jgi:hypothetical protein
MRNRLKLNEKAVRDLEPVKGRDHQVFDSEISGFAIRVYRSGSKAFTLDYRINGRQRRYKLGAWPEWSATAARERVKEVRRQIDEGIDPLAIRADVREAPKFSDMIDRYIEEHLPRLAPRNASDQISMLRKMVQPEWGHRLVSEISNQDVALRANKRETFDWLKFTLEGEGERTHGYAFTDTAFARYRV